MLGSALVMFARDRTSGVLTPAGCVTTRGASVCRAGANLQGVGIADGDVLVSPDSRSVIVTLGMLDASGNAVLNVLERDPRTQALSLSGCVSAYRVGRCRTDGRLRGEGDFGLSLAQSPDGRFVYANGWTSGNGVSFVILAREFPSGRLRVSGCLAELEATAGCGPRVTLGGVSDTFAVSPTGYRFVSLTSDAVALFERDPISGALSPIGGQRGCVSSTGRTAEPQNQADVIAPERRCQDARALRSAGALAFAPGGRHLYVAAGRSIVTLRVD